MDIQQARRIIRNTFEGSFNKVKFIDFIKDLFNQYDESKAFHLRGCYIPKAFENIIKSYERIGTYNDPEGKKIDLLIVYLKKETTIDRARTAQRNFIANYLKGRGEKDAGLVAFVSPEEDDWRFSFVKMEYKFEKTPKGDVKVKEEFTAARRYSFLVGKNESSHTAQSCFIDILKNDDYNPTIYELEEAFNIEKVTKEFFEKYRDLFLQIKDSLDEVVKKDEEIRKEFQEKGINTVDFSKKLLGQIVFLYFLQKKGWFGVPRGKDWGGGDKKFLRSLFNIAKKENRNYFNKFLEPLFYEALRLERPKDYYAQFSCRIPFLNGGLFDPLNDYDWQDTDIEIPNEIFSNNHKTKEGDTGDGILDIFDRYNFTVKEDEPLEKEVAVDPEMLGKVFENLLEVKDRKSKGTYYTPREIVHYMCQQSLINYLYSEMNSKQKSRTKEEKIQMKLLGKPNPIQQSLIIEKDSNIISKEDIEKLIKYGDTTIENDNHVATKGEETKTYSFKLPENIRKNAEIIDEVLKNIRVCDPAIGSGAFPVGMMNEIIRARNVLTSYLSLQEAEVMKQSRTIYNFKRHAIQNSIYGVDIDPGAVEIAKLRLWLSLIVDEEDIKHIKPLPNLDYKIVCGNSLLGVERNLENWKLFAQLEELKPLFFNETNVNKKQEYKIQIDGIISKITNGHKDFDFEVYFSEIFHEKNGFDVVIANPPYIGEKGNKEIFRETKRGPLKRYYLRKMDIFYFFFHLSLNIARTGGEITFITTNYYITADGAKKLRQDFKTRSIIQRLINFNELKIFESAKGQHNIVTMLEKGFNINAIAKTAITKRIGYANSEILQKILHWQDEDTIYWGAPQKNFYEADENYIRMGGNIGYMRTPTQKIFGKIKNNSKLLRDFCNINQGLLTGVDRITAKHIKNNLINENCKHQGVYVLNQEELKELNLSQKELMLIYPFYKNSDIKKYYCNQTPNKYVIHITRDLNIDEYPNLRNHFYKYKKVINARSKERGEMQAALKLGKWWVIFAARDKNIFLNPKIICPQRSYRNNFAYNEVDWFGSADVYFITLKDDNIKLKYVLSLLNSNLYFFWLYFRGKRKGEMLELLYTPLSEIPIKKISLSQQKPFINLVDKILTITKNDDYLVNSGKQSKVHEYEHQIDEMVYKLYNLTPEEIEIVEGCKNK